MTEIPIVVSNESFTLGGRTEQIELQLSVGATGERGSRIFTGSVPPVSLPIGSPEWGGYTEFKPGDIYLLRDTGVLEVWEWLYASTEYTWVKTVDSFSGDSFEFTPRYSVGISSGYGLVSASEADRERELQMYADLGASLVRIDVDWSYVERTQGTYDWSVVDHTFVAAARHGIQVVGILAYSPEWATTVPGENHAPPTDLGDFAAFCAAAAGRYRGNVWEVWNEPNISNFWLPVPDPATYTDLVQGAYAAIKAADPTATVLAGALSPAVDEVDGTGISPVTFTTECYTAGIKDYFDHWSVHPYCYPAAADDDTTIAWNTFQRLPLVRAVMEANGDGAKRIWLTEFGAPTGTHPTAVDEEEQARQILTGLIQSLVWRDWTGPLFIYCGRDPGTDPANREDNFGLVYRNWTPKPSFTTLRHALVNGVTIPPGSGAPQTLKIGGAAGTERYLVFQTDGDTRWKVGANPDTEDPMVPGSGTNFVIARYDEAGAFLDNPLDISRETGGVSMSSLWLRGGPLDNVSEINVTTPASIAGEVEAPVKDLLAALDALGLLSDDTTLGGGGGGTSDTVAVDGAAEDYKRVAFRVAGLARFEWGLSKDSEDGDLSLRIHDKVTGAYISTPVYVESGTGRITQAQTAIRSVTNDHIALDVRAATVSPAASVFRASLSDGTVLFDVDYQGTMWSNWGAARFAAVKLGCTQVVREGAGSGNTVLAAYTSTANADADAPVFEVRGSGAVQIGAAENATDAVRKDQIKAIVAASTDFADFKTRMAAW